MANTKQAQKMVRKIKKRNSYNRMWKERIKQAIKNLDELISQTNPNAEQIEKAYRDVQKTTDKAVKSGVIKRNKSNRIKSRLAASY